MLRRTQIWLVEVLLLSAVITWAEPVSQLHPSNYVNDFAHVLNPQTEDQLNSICEQLDHQAKAQVAVVTINTLEGQDVESYGVDLFHKWGIGSKSNDHGVLILLAIQDHRGRIEVGYGLEPILPDGKTGGFNREAIPFLKQGDYDAAIRLMTIRVADVIAQDAGIQLTGSPQAPRSNYPAAPGISLGRIALLVLIAIIVLATPLRKVLFWWLLFSGGPRWGGGYRSGGGWGGGGFGGGGGGGFGGFGGGSSGGGGSSFGW
jgi:uncharacterized protein